jgi:hypothetical protein
MGKVADTRENFARCICGECPSKPEDLTALYCAKGKSPARVKARGCLCSDCPLTPEFDLTNDYYCEAGVVE